MSIETKAVVDRLDAAIDGRCPCGADPAPGSAYCSDDCRPTHRGPDTDAPWLGGSHAARWRPDLVTAFDESDLRLVTELTAEDRREADVMDRGASGFTWRGYRHRDGRYFVRVDDGHRWVGAFTASREDAGRAMRERLERELSDRRRLDPEPPTEDTAPTLLLTLGEPDRHRVANYWGMPGVRERLMRWLAANGVAVADVMLGASAEIRDGQLTVECVTRDDHGCVLAHDDGEPVTERRTVPLVEAPPEPHLVEETIRIQLHAPDATPEQLERIRRAAQAVAAQSDQAVRDHVRAMAQVSDAAGRAAGELRRVLWLPEVEDPENPTAAELDRAVDLTPHLAGARPAATFVDDGQRVDWAAVEAATQAAVEQTRTRLAGWWRTYWASIRSDGLRSWLLGWAAAWWRRRYRPWGWLLVQSDRLHDLFGSGWLRLRRLLGGCPGHGRRTCFVCDWVRGKAAEPRGRLDVRLSADTQQFQTAAYRIGREMVAAGVSTAPVPEAIRVQVAEEQARLELRAVVGDGYNAAMVAARERGLSTRGMVNAAAMGVWTAEHGWTDEGSSR